MNQTRFLYQTQRQDLQFESYKESIKRIVEEDWIGNKYKKQLEKKKFFIIDKIDNYLQKLKPDGNVITLFCEFTFDSKLTLFIKAENIRDEFINSSSPSYFCGKNNQLDLFQQLSGIRENILVEFDKFNSWLKKKQNQNQEVWGLADWYLKTNTQQEADKYREEAEKCRKNMIQYLYKNEDLSKYLEFQFYLETYLNYFDDLSVQQRNEIHQEFKQLMLSLKDNYQVASLNQNIQNNILYYKNKKFVINRPMDPSLNIPIFLWNEIQHFQLQGFVLCLMVDLEKNVLNFKVIRDMLRDLRRRNQPHPNQQRRNIYQ